MEFTEGVRFHFPSFHSQEPRADGWMVERRFVPLPKSENPERIKANADVYGFELSAEEVAAIDALDKGKEGAITWNPIDAE